MAAFPNHQYRGAGAMLTAWGTQRADEINALCLFEAVSAARWMYEKAGFVVQRHFTVRPKGKHGEEGFEGFEGFGAGKCRGCFLWSDRRPGAKVDVLLLNRLDPLTSLPMLQLNS
ncbi:hypothetical protein K458DRAFT_410976 [Lentithecium fluviatile CBS 122367]|uniref:N-acetyltransferase domain-containing protein n=1 Tax=Lentithecium fluviatile CBS 122367 TaxID=1168545 RepID=A0A6G1ICY1_9PLEO|nr:hypothetical protein K458DRAFT_410976 [Lentithecium fluviatile CBS 122367]